MTKKEAADFLGVGMRTLERYTSDGRLTPDKIKGKNGLTLDYRTEDLERLKVELAAIIPSPPIVAATLATPTSETALARVIPRPATLARVSPPPSPEAVSIVHKLTLSLDEAAALSGFSSRRLRQAVAEGKLHAVRVGRGFRLRGEDLKAFVNSIFDKAK